LNSVACGTLYSYESLIIVTFCKLSVVFLYNLQLPQVQHASIEYECHWYANGIREPA